jgi:Ca2+-binding EF-hand superfamily protein
MRHPLGRRTSSSGGALRERSLVSASYAAAGTSATSIGHPGTRSVASVGSTASDGAHRPRWQAFFASRTGAGSSSPAIDRPSTTEAHAEAARRAQEEIDRRRWRLLNDVMRACKLRRDKNGKLLSILQQLQLSDATDDDSLIVTMEEFVTRMRDTFGINAIDVPLLRQLFRLFDKSGTGVADFRAIAMALASVVSSGTDIRHEVRFCFDSFDSQRRGFISRMDMARLVRLSLVTRQTERNMRLLLPEAFDAKVREHLVYFDIIDTDHDQQVSLDELEAAVDIDPIFLEVFGYERHPPLELLVQSPLPRLRNQAPWSLLWGIIPYPDPAEDLRILAAQLIKLKKIAEMRGGMHFLLVHNFKQMDTRRLGYLEYEDMKEAWRNIRRWFNKPADDELAYIKVWHRLDPSKDNRVIVGELEPFFEETLEQGASLLEAFLLGTKPQVLEELAEHRARKKKTVTTSQAGVSAPPALPLPPSQAPYDASSSTAHQAPGAFADQPHSSSVVLLTAKETVDMAARRIESMKT